MKTVYVCTLSLLYPNPLFPICRYNISEKLPSTESHDVAESRGSTAIDIITHPKKKLVIQAFRVMHQVSCSLVPVFGDSVRGALAGQISFCCVSTLGRPEEDRTGGCELLAGAAVVVVLMMEFVPVKEQGGNPVPLAEIFFFLMGERKTHFRE